MKKQKAFLTLAFLLLLIVTGCASSERMLRMSGGVMGNYQAPEKHRIRSAKYRSIERNSSMNRFSQVVKAGDKGKHEALVLEKNLLNLWPLYFRSGQYVSILWPCIDKDPYGFAFRPFYNHEGDDTSILFPLSSWNHAEGTGWCFPAIWGKEYWAVLPLVFWSPESAISPLFFKVVKGGKTTIGSPIFWYSAKKWLPTIYSPHATSSSGFYSLIYGGSNTRKQYGEKKVLIDDNRYPGDLAGQKKLAAKLGPLNLPMPKTNDEFQALRQKVFEEAPWTKDYWWGIFPLLHVTSSDDSFSSHVLWRLFAYKAQKTHYDGNQSKYANGKFLYGLGASWYSNEKSFFWDSTKSYSSFMSILLMSYYRKDIAYKMTEKEEKAKKLFNSLGQDEIKREWLAKKWSELYPEAPLPEYVYDKNSFKRFLTVFYRDMPHESETAFLSTGCLPLFHYKSFKDQKSLHLPILLTSYRSLPAGGHFWSIPLLSYFDYSERQDIRTIAGPLGWYSKTRRFSRDSCHVYAHDQFVPQRDRDCVELIDDYAACWLMYHGKHVFMVAKEGYDNNDINDALSKVAEDARERQYLDINRQRLTDRTARNHSKVTKTRREELLKLLEEEDIRLEELELQKKEKAYEEKRQKLCEVMGRLNIPLKENGRNEPGDVEALKEKIYDQCTTLRSYEDHGNGLFFHREKYENGDGSWMFMFGLAGGHKIGSAHEKHILYFLYRDRKQGDTEELLVFPFISHQREGNNTRTSFLGRIWQKTVVDGKTSGYFCFIPYGEK